VILKRGDNMRERTMKVSEILLGNLNIAAPLPTLGHHDGASFRHADQSPEVQEAGEMPKIADTNKPATAAETERNGARFDSLYREKRRLFGPSVAGKYVVIQIQTGQFLIAGTARAALERARVEFGSTDWCWTRQIGPL
jgi:hypothetical protein